MVDIGKRLTSVLAATLLAASGCSKKDDDDNSKSSGSTKNLTEVTKVGDLNLSNTFKVELPAALTGGSGSLLRLAAGKRSHEACEIGKSIGEVTRDLSTIGSFFCHLDVESDKIKFGTKYKIISGGQEFGRIYVDNSKAADGEIYVYMCEPDANGNSALKEQIAIKGVTENGAKGTVRQKGSESPYTWATNIEFDAEFTTAGSITITADQAYTDSENDSAFKRHVMLSLLDEGVSNVILASNGSWQGTDFAQRAKAMFNGEVGAALFSNAGTHQSQTFEWTHNSFFDDDGFVLSDPSMYDAFAKGGDLHIALADLPEFLAADFTPAAPQGYDCSFDEEIELDPESAEHLACDEGRDDDEDGVDCYADEFAEGEAHVEGE